MALNKPKIIVVLGPTASGKSDLAVEIALRLRSGQTKKLGINGAEIISADSRQVYQGMDIGTGKITKKETAGIKHYLLDVARPKYIFTAIDYKKLAEQAITEILKKGKIPIICGGTGFYIHALLSGLEIPEVAPDWKLRKKLEKKTTEQLFEMLKKLDLARAKNIDSKNPRRLIRAIEIALRLPSISFRASRSGQAKKLPATRGVAEKYDILWLGIKKSGEELKNLIKSRLLKRIKLGMINEVKKLHADGVSWKRLDDLGLEYRYVNRYLRKKISKEEMIEQLNSAINQFAKRQMTWFKKYAPETRWFENKKEAAILAKKFLLK